jgi:DNA-binding response OmpR family regulator
VVKVAIVEDEAAIADMYKLKLQQAGFEVKVASNGRQGLELCQQMRPDIVLLDLMMPEMSGKEMLEKMQSTAWGKDILVLLLTNLSQSEADIDVGKAHFDGYAVKAYYTPKQLLEKVVALLKDSHKLSQEWTAKA